MGSRSMIYFAGGSHETNSISTAEGAREAVSTAENGGLDLVVDGV